jgi:transposase
LLMLFAGKADMITLQTFNALRFLRERKGMSFRGIAHRLRLNARTVRKWARRDWCHTTKHITRSSVLDAFKPDITRDWELALLSSAEIFRRARERGYVGSYTILRRFLRSVKREQPHTISPPLLPAEWMLRLLQGKLKATTISAQLGESVAHPVEALVSRVRNGSLRVRNRAIAVLAHLKGFPITAIARFLMVDRRMVQDYVRDYGRSGIDGLTTYRRTGLMKHEQQHYKESVFALLHSPPTTHGVNRTSWRMDDLRHILRTQGIWINKNSIRRIIRGAGFRFRSARTVLTSTDPQYREKLAEVTRTLSSITDTQKFFSIDEYGPFSVKIQGGRALAAPGEQRVVPQWQKSKGRLTLVGALELSTNQMTHFYADRKSTAEMIRLMHVLLIQYHDQSLLYLSWDAASWHASKAFVSEVDLVNAAEYRSAYHTPAIALVPLPACAQFLNVIESVFSGMAKAIIHNSDYNSVEECKEAIDRYYAERNQFFREHPKRAGNKIWGKERCPAVFSPSNNCKDPTFA